LEEFQDIYLVTRKIVGQVDEAIENLDPKEVGRSLGGVAALEFFSHKVIRNDGIPPDDRDTIITFASPYVENEVTQKMLEKYESDYFFSSIIKGLSLTCFCLRLMDIIIYRKVYHINIIF